MRNKVVELVNLWAKYEEEQPGLDIRDFCIRYLAEQPLETDESNWAKEKMPINGILAMLVGKLNRYAGYYYKMAFQDQELTNVEDVIYLGRIEPMGNPKKSELIFSMLSEFPSGIEVIKRLTQAGMVEEYPDELDRRSKRLRLTERGREFLHRAYPLLDRVGALAFDRLTLAEKTTLIHLMGRLDTFHGEHYKKARAAETFDEIGAILQAPDDNRDDRLEEKP